jgi:hypothetical protein
LLSQNKALQPKNVLATCDCDVNWATNRLREPPDGDIAAVKKTVTIRIAGFLQATREGNVPAPERACRNVWSKVAAKSGVDVALDMHVGLSDWETDGPPAWARRPLAWVARLIDALPLTIALLAFFQWRVGAVSAIVAVGLYLLIAALLALALRPAKASASNDRSAS